VSQREQSSQHFNQNYAFLKTLRRGELQEVRRVAVRARRRIRSVPSEVREDAETELEKLELSRQRLESQVARDKELAVGQAVTRNVRVAEVGSTERIKQHKYLKKG
jgi:hypothetical protein